MAILTIVTVDVRLHENLPFVSLLRPVVLTAYGGLLLLWLETPLATVGVIARDRALRLIFAYFGWAIVTAPFALWPGLAVNLTVICFPIIIMCVAVMLCRTDERTLDKCLTGLVAAVTTLGFATLAHRGEAMGRLSAEGTFDPNDLAAVAAMSFPFALGLLGRGTKPIRLLGLLAVVVCPYIVIATSSRGGTMAIVIAALVYALGTKGKRALLLTLLLAGAMGAWTFAPASFRERIQTLSSLDEDYNNTEYTGRRQIWRRAVGYVEEHPIAGVGLGNFPIAEGGYAAQIGIRTKWSAAHNAYIQAFAELGIVGGGLFLAIFGVALRRAARLWRAGEYPEHRLHRPEFLASLISFGVSAYFLSHAYFGLFFGVVALTSLAIQVVSNPGHPSRSTRGRTRLPSGYRGGQRVSALR